ncbi:MAG: 2,3-bisphosphoglycerate-dependent phosphoglycerate mutase [Planctomycetota bacterium]
MSGELIIMRHGRSVFNEQGRYAGWLDTPLSPAGHAEAIDAGRALGAIRCGFDVAVSSALMRARDTLDLVLGEAGPAGRVVRDWRLNERHYGAMQGLTLEEGRSVVGEAAASRLMTDFDARPPATPAPALADGEPFSETLDEAGDRAHAAWREHGEPAWLEGGRVVLVAHGGVLRALLVRLGAVSVQEARGVRLGTAVPMRVTPEIGVEPCIETCGDSFTGWT